MYGSHSEGPDWLGKVRLLPTKAQKHYRGTWWHSYPFVLGQQFFQVRGGEKRWGQPDYVTPTWLGIGDLPGFL